jgi:DNA-binding PadR family transcriptional regulator
MRPRLILNVSKKKSPVYRYFSDREWQLVEFLFKHRIATFETIRTKFYPDIHPKNCYNRLRNLEDSKYLETRMVPKIDRKLYILGEYGYLRVRDHLGIELKGARIAPDGLFHDHLASAVLLGDWYLIQPDKTKILTEQELLTYPKSFLPTWMHGENSHRSDGYWIFEKEQESIYVALEVETSEKTFSRYQEICSFHDSTSNVRAVIWIVKSEGTANRILRASHSISLGIKREIHKFIHVEDLWSNLWQANFMVGNDCDKKETLGQYLNSLSENKGAPRHTPSITPRHTPSHTTYSTHPLLNGKIDPRKQVPTRS